MKSLIAHRIALRRLASPPDAEAAQLLAGRAVPKLIQTLRCRREYVKWMAGVDTNRPGFQPLGCGSICTQGFALGWYRSAPLALEVIRRVWIFGEPLGCGSICTQGIPPQGARSAPWGPRFALGWYRSAPLALEAIRRVWIFGGRHNFGSFSN